MYSLMRAIAGWLLSSLKKYIAIFIVVVVWEVLPRIGLVDTFLLPPFSVVIKSLVQLVLSGEIAKHLAISFQRSFIGFVVGVGIAIPLGILVGWCSKFEEIIDPLLQACRNSSVLALYPVFLLFFGLNEVSKTAIIIWGTVWPTLINAIAGVKDTDQSLIKAARSMGISNFGLLHKVIVPALLPYLLTGVRLSATNSILLLVAAEMIGANAGLGYIIFAFQEGYAIPQMYAGVLTLSFIGVLVNALLVRMGKQLLVNRGGNRV